MRRGFDLSTQQSAPGIQSDGVRGRFSVSSAKVSAGCRKFLDANERARVQWKLEEDFSAFEKRF